METLTSLEYSHDLRLPDWGPYTKKYTGISHLPSLRSGLRFDLSVFPGYYRRQVLVPNAKWESGFYPWEAAPDLGYFAYRYELEWKDRVFCDTSFSEISPNARLVRSEFHNSTAQPQNVVLHYMASMNFPPVKTYSDEAVRPSRFHLPPGAVWLDSLDYDELRFADPRPQDNLVYDGLRRGEVRGHGFVGGSGIGMGFGGGKGDWVEYTFHLAEELENPVLLVRYRADPGSARFLMSGLANGELELPACQDFNQVLVNIHSLPAGKTSLHLVSQGDSAVELDGFVLLPQQMKDETRFEPVEWQPVPQILDGPQPNSLVLKYVDCDTYYGLTWLGEPWVLRQFFSNELDRLMRYYVQEHVQKMLYGNGEGHFTNVFIRPIEVPPGESRVLYAMVCSGDYSQVETSLAAFDPDPEKLEFIDQNGKARAARMYASPAGEKYHFSQDRMAATVLTNVVYPVYTRRSFIRHYTPGKWWDCLYTWDSGFIGLGLLELDHQRAVDCLNAYTTPPGDSQAAFLHHGSMVPTQHYLFHELWNRTQDRSILEYFYPRLRQYYRFFAGHLGSSTTRRMRSGLLKTWDYFYNSGGWDDYPPQVYVHHKRLEDTTTPVISTAHGIRIAKILQQAARALGETEDTTEYQADIDTWTAALNRYAWDAQAGYFSYVRHTPQGEPLEFLRHESGQNYNMGLDGASPYFAGVCSQEQMHLILERLASADRMWTPLGICTVDKTAAYYRVDGYWNGAVWFPQQWFFWKALLDAGQTAFAAQIARTALDTWQAEVDASYNCFEHFIVQTGRGAGWHHFGGLSTPVLLWYGACYRPGRLTTGFDVWVQRLQATNHNRRLEAEIVSHGRSGQPFAVLASMAAGESYRVSLDDEIVPCHERLPGLLEIQLSGKPAPVNLVIQSEGKD